MGIVEALGAGFGAVRAGLSAAGFLKGSREAQQKLWPKIDQDVRGFEHLEPDWWRVFLTLRNDQEHRVVIHALRVKNSVWRRGFALGSNPALLSAQFVERRGVTGIKPTMEIAFDRFELKPADPANPGVHQHKFEIMLAQSDTERRYKLELVVKHPGRRVTEIRVPIEITCPARGQS